MSELPEVDRQGACGAAARLTGGRRASVAGHARDDGQPGLPGRPGRGRQRAADRASARWVCAPAARARRPRRRPHGRLDAAGPAINQMITNIELYYINGTLLLENTFDYWLEQ